MKRKTDVANLLKKINLEKLILTLPGHIYIKDVNGIYIFCNDEQAKTLGFDNGKDVVGKTDFDLPWKNEAKNLVQTDKEIIETGCGKKTIEVVTLKNGQVATFFSNKIPYVIDGNVACIVGCSNDISEQKAMEDKLKEISLYQNAQMYAVEQKFKDNLSGIIGSSEMAIELLLKKEENVDKLLDLLHQILSSGKKINNTINEAIDFIELQNINKDSLDKDVISPSSLIKTVVGELREIAKHNNVIILINDCCLNGFMCITNYLYAKKILHVIASNALKYTRNGYVVFDIKYDDNKKLLTFAITDTGKGISNSRQKGIFDIYSLDKSDPLYKNAGYSLSNAKILLDILEGNILVKSDLGKGATFVVNLPSKIESKVNNKQARLYGDDVAFIIVNESEKIAKHISKHINHHKFICFSEKTKKKDISAYLVKEKNSKIVPVVVFTENNAFIEGALNCIDIKNWRSFGIVITPRSDSAQPILNLRNNFLYISTEEFLFDFYSKYSEAQKIWSIESDRGTLFRENKTFINVLIIEDSKISYITLSRMLSRYNCDIVIEETAENALSKFKNKSFDIVFTDIGLPGISGDAFVKKIIRENKGIDRKVLFIAVSAFVDEKSREKYLDAGVCEVLSKPVSTVDIDRVISRYYPSMVLR